MPAAPSEYWLPSPTTRFQTQREEGLGVARIQRQQALWPGGETNLVAVVVDHGDRKRFGGKL
jgi:hypothetical protein